MKAYFLFPLIAASIVGCAGLDITPLSTADEENAHKTGTKIKGYIIYEPIVVVEVIQKKLCSVTDPTTGKCTGTPVITCSAGTPFVLPDTSKPFLVNARSGFGHAGVEVAITDGWKLTSIKDTSDNTQVFGMVEKILGLVGIKSIAREAAAGECKAAGLYRVDLETKGVKLSPLLIY